MASIVSLYSAAVTALVMNDHLPPEAPELSLVEASQNTSGGTIPAGRMQVTLHWTLPTLNERLPGEFLGAATGSTQDMETAYLPLAASPALELYEVTGQSGGSSVLSSPAARGDLSVEISDTTDFAAEDWIELENGPDHEFNKIRVVDGYTLTFYNRLRMVESWASGTTTVKECQVLPKVVTTDYTVNLSLGTLVLLTGQFTSGNNVFATYSTTLQDLDHFELYRIPGTFPVPSPATYADVVGYGGSVLVFDNISGVSTQATESLTAAENGKTFTYYLFALDDETTPNPSVSDAILIEMFTSIPQGMERIPGDAQIILFWNVIADPNFNGVNIYRCDGDTFVASSAKKLNSIPVTVATFDDSVNNLLNRVVPEIVPFPQNGSLYTYRVESEDTITTWTTGTWNTSDGVTEQLTATKVV